MDKERNKFYFIFENTYLIVIADCKGEAMTKFQKKYSKRDANFVYSEEQWNRSWRKRYYSEKPEEIIV